jgi:hypothetical protein
MIATTGTAPDGMLATGAPPRNRCGAVEDENRPVIPRPGHAAALLRSRGRRAEESTVGTREAGRGSPHKTCGRATAGQGRSGVSRQAPRRRTVDFSVARQVCRAAGFRAALLRNDSLALCLSAGVFRFRCSERRTLNVKTGLSFRGPATLSPDQHASGRRVEESAVGTREAGRGSPHKTCGRATAGQGRSGVSRQAPRRRTVDFSVARRACRTAGSARRSFEMTVP